MDIAAEFLSAIVNAFEANKRLADRAVEQVPDDKLHTALDANTNSVAVIMKHVAGNLTSRWTDFLTTDGTVSLARRGVVRHQPCVGVQALAWQAPDALKRVLQQSRQARGPGGLDGLFDVWQ